MGYSEGNFNFPGTADLAFMTGFDMMFGVIPHVGPVESFFESLHDSVLSSMS